MKKTIFTSIILIGTITLISLSCKKTDKVTSGSSSTGSATTTAGTTTGGTTTGGTTTGGTTTGNGSPTGTFNGILLALSFTSGTVTVNTGFAEFFNTAIAINLGTPLVATASVTSVFMNGTQFPYNSSGMSYFDSTSALTFPPATWNVTGAGIIPSFTYTNNDAIPTFTGTSSLPVTIDKTQNLVIPINGLSGCDQIRVSLNDTVGKSTFVLISGSATSATIVKDSLTKLTPCSSGSYSLDFIKYNPQTIGTKKILFSTYSVANKAGIFIY